MAFEERVDVHSDLHEIRTNAIKTFETKGFPTKKEEAWKYTSLNSPCLKNDFQRCFQSRKMQLNSIGRKKVFPTRNRHL
jgi:Fe-S cluster assembly protein SufD